MLKLSYTKRTIWQNRSDKIKKNPGKIQEFINHTDSH
jgi:nuclear transport factor 2 (NTF2) superfamily protein